MVALMERVVGIIEKNMRTAKRSEDPRELTGVSTKRFATIGGKKYMIKAENNKETIIEVFAYRLGKALGLNVLPVFFIENKFKDSNFKGVDILSVHEWDKTFQLKEQFDDYDDSISKTFNQLCKDLHYDVMTMRAFDMIIGNEDRHSGNWGFSKDENDEWQLAMIDHGLSYTTKYYDAHYHFTMESYNFDFKDKLVYDGCEATFDIASKFVAIEDEQFKKMLKDLEKYNSTACKSILTRMLEFKRVVKDTLEYMEKEKTDQ